MTDIFIGCGCYGDRALAARVADVLEADGYRVCRDPEKLDIGDYIDRITPAITECTDFIIPLTPGVFSGCTSRDDLLRLELEAAFKYRRNVVIFRTPEFEWNHILPENISKAEYCRTVECRRDDFLGSMEKLISVLTAKPTGNAKSVLHSIKTY